MRVHQKFSSDAESPLTSGPLKLYIYVGWLLLLGYIVSTSEDAFIVNTVIVATAP